MQHELTQQVLGLVANVTGVSALLVYFGWRRAETQAQLMGFDESLLSMSTQDYLLRSIGPLLPTLVIVGAAGLAWVWADRWIQRSIEARGRPVRVWRALVIALALALPLTVRLSAPWWIETAFVMYPLAIGAGVLLLVYAGSLGGAGRNRTLAKVFALLIVAVCLFWSASNKAEVLGGEIADQYAGGVRSLIRVTVYSSEQLYLDGPGVTEEQLTGEHAAYRYRYRGLRLLDHIGQRYFLVSDGWSPQRGVVIALGDRDGLRFEFSSGQSE
jgi:hypothetical protein